MEISITHIFLVALLTFLIGYLVQKKRVKKLERKILDAEDAVVRTDKDYLAVLKENEELKEEISKQHGDEERIQSLQELLRKKKA